IMVGLGRGEGEINVIGGSFETKVNTSLPPKPMVVGFASGLGHVNVSNGTFDLGVRPAYVGGGTLAELGLEGAMPPNTHYEDMHDATGTVTVAAADLSKPCRFTTTSDIYVGKDGVGTIELGAGGLVKATGTIALCNGAHSTLKFVCGPNGAGKVECDKLIVSQGAKLIVDVSACEVGGKGLNLVTFNSKEGEFAVADMELVGLKPGMTYRLVQTANRIRLSSGMGLFLVVE
ncbi:MAG: hypothetical protein KBT68_12720, partial [bacterium]|nr:hypothetical protein [Candidatus Colisoma equi]